MKGIAAVVAGFLIAAPMPARAHIAVQPKYEAQFYAWTSCYKRVLLENSLTCNFPMQGGDHYDAITVFCEETEMVPHWYKEWMKKFGSLNLSEATNEEWHEYMQSMVLVPAYTVQYLSYHIRNKKGFSFFQKNKIKEKEKNSKSLNKLKNFLQEE